VVSVPYAGGVPRVLYTLPATAKGELQGYLPGPTQSLVTVSGEPAWKSYLAVKDELRPLPLTSADALSADGRLVLGKRQFDEKSQVVLYNVETAGVMALTGIPLQVEAEAFGKVLNQLVAAAPDEFKGIRAGEGKAIGPTRVYDSSTELPGATAMEITVPAAPGRFNPVRLEAKLYSGRDKPTGEAAYAKLISLAKAALPGWNVQENSIKTATVEQRTAEFVKPGTPAKVNLEFTYGATFNITSVNLKVSRTY
jgi:hypothetical protein